VLVSVLAAQVCACTVAHAQVATCTGIVRPNPAPNTFASNMWAGAIRSAAASDMGGIWGDVLDPAKIPVKTSNFQLGDYAWVMLASGADKNNVYGLDWVQIGTGWAGSSANQEYVWEQLNNPQEPLFNYEQPVVNPAWIHYTLSFDPCNACTYDQYNHPATGWSYAWYSVQNLSSPGTLLKEVPITFHPTSAEYAAETNNYGDQIGGTMDGPQRISSLAYYYPAGSGTWYWMGTDDSAGMTAWAPDNTSPYAVSEPPQAYYNSGGATTDLVIYDMRCPS